MSEPESPQINISRINLAGVGGLGMLAMAIVIAFAIPAIPRFCWWRWLAASSPRSRSSCGVAVGNARTPRVELDLNIPDSLLNDDKSPEPRRFLRPNVFADFLVELLLRFPRTVFLELTDHSWPRSRN